MELQIGQQVALIKGGTVVDGLVSGWMVAGGEVAHIFIEEIESPFRLIGENAWQLATLEDENGEI